MTPGILLVDLRGRGVALAGDGDRLRYRPADRLTPADRAAVVERKAALLALLTDLATLEADGTAARLRGIYADLPATDRQRLADEAADGDVLAELLLAAVAGALDPGSLRAAQSDPVVAPGRDHQAGSARPEQAPRGVPTAREAR